MNDCIVIYESNYFPSCLVPSCCRPCLLLKYSPVLFHFCNKTSLFFFLSINYLKKLYFPK